MTNTGIARPAPHTAETATAQATETRRDGRSGGMFSALANRDYRIFFGGALVTNAGMWMQQVAQGWLVVSLTDSAFLVGLVAFCAMAPMLLLSLFGGVLADRVPKRMILLVSQPIAFALLLLLAALIATEQITIWSLMAISAGLGVVGALSAPAFQAIVPEIVGKANLRNAIALNSAQFNVTRIIGPTLGGLVVLGFGAAAAYLANAITNVVFWLAILFIRPKYASAKAQTSPDGVFASLKVAFAYVRTHPVIGPVLLLAMAQTIWLFPYGTLLPVFAKQILRMDAQGFSLLLISAGVGALAASLMLARRGNDVAASVRWMLGAQVGFALSTSVFAFSRLAPLSMVALAFMGWSFVTFMATGNTIVQTLVPDELRGRVMSVWMLAGFGVMPIGSLQAGAVASIISPTAALVYGAIATVCVTTLVVRRNPHLVRPERIPSIVAHA